MEFPSKKLYYRIGEVAGIVGVETHVLRYWETEFPSLSPRKNRAGQRVYRPQEIETLLLIKQLLYEEGFTIAGARKRLARSRPAVPAPAPPPIAGEQQTPANSPAGGTDLRTPPEQAFGGEDQKRSPAKDISKVRAELENMLTLLDRE